MSARRVVRTRDLGEEVDRQQDAEEGTYTGTRALLDKPARVKRVCPSWHTRRIPALLWRWAQIERGVPG
jgi:hypothetical protein